MKNQRDRARRDATSRDTALPSNRALVFAFASLIVMVAVAAWPLLRSPQRSAVVTAALQDRFDSDRDATSDVLPSNGQGVGRAAVGSHETTPTSSTTPARAVVPPTSPWETPGPEDEGESDEPVPEDEGGSQLGEASERRAWREAFTHEVQDEVWTERMQKQLEQQIASGARDGVDLSGLSCRETLCDAVLHFDRREDAEAFQQAERAPGLEYLLQSLSPNVPNGGSEEWGYSYELMIKRERAQASPQESAPRRTTPAAAVAAVPPGGRG